MIEAEEGDEADPLLPTIAAAYGVALAAACLHPRVAQAGASPVANGLRIGALLVATWFLPQALFLVGITETTLAHAAMDVGWHLVVEQSVGGIALALAYGAVGEA